ncbi:MAG TPA: GH92 family glycosyl hydrolase, partial [Candidatus Limnocylindrales bacterium]|nr:GH92 family glycosyl hydrolase [Candidatus Limnocylindrales bacterium]
MRTARSRRFGTGIVGVFVCILAVASSVAEKAPLQCVDPRIGSAHCRWFFFAPGAMPFGLAKPGPSTDGHYGNKSGWEAIGYDGRHDSIEGFPNFHEFQIGGVVLMPTTGKLVTVPGPRDKAGPGYRSHFDKAEEVAQPGYYAVRLKDYSIRAELTATPRVSFHRYTFPASTNAHLLFDIGNQQGESGPVLDAAVRWNGTLEVEGFVSTHPEYARLYQPGACVRMYFVGRLSKTPRAVGTFRGPVIHPGERAILGPGAGLYLDFETTEQEAIEVKLGQSYTSIANARINLEREAGELSFDQAKEQAQARWSEMLGRVEVEGGKIEDRIKFYTGLYHALQGRGLASDVNGAYPRNDGGIGQIPTKSDGSAQFNIYNTDAVWGAFWNLTQLWALAYPDYLSEFVRCQLAMYRDCGWLPDSIAAGKFVSGVGTDFMGLVLSSAYEWGIRDYDVNEAWTAVAKNETGWENRPLGVGKMDTKIFLDLGYVPQISSENLMLAATPEGSQYSASHTLEYSFSAYAAAQFAQALGKAAEHERFMRLSHGWEKLLDPKTGFIRPRDREGKFLANFDPKQAWRGFQEGNAYQYTFYVPHDPASLISELGPEKFNQRLEDIFARAEKARFGGGETVDAFAGLEAVYNHGNQPSLHIAWLFNYGGKPWLTQRWVRRICDVFYGIGLVHGYGYGQDEDQGQLGAWFVLASLGLFDV